MTSFDEKNILNKKEMKIETSTELNQEKKFNTFENINHSRNLFSIKNEKQRKKVSLSIKQENPILTLNRTKNNCSSKIYNPKNKIKNFKLLKSRNLKNIQINKNILNLNNINCINKTNDSNNIINCHNTNNTLSIKRFNYTIYNKENINTINEKNINNIFEVNMNDNKKYKKKKNIFLQKKDKTKENNIIFSQKEKDRIYKSYFCVHNIKKQKNVFNDDNKSNNFISISDDNDNIPNGQNLKRISKKKYNSYKINNKKTYINNYFIQNNKNIIDEIEKYKKKLNKLKIEILINKRKIKSLSEENKKIELYISNNDTFRNRNINDENKSFFLKICKIIDLLNNNINNSERNNILNNMFNIIMKIKNQYDEKKLIDDIINLMKGFYLDYNYSFSSKDTKKIINFNEISTKILWNWIKNVPKLIFYENIKNNLKNIKNTNNIYEIFIQNLFEIFGVNSFPELQASLNNLYKK